MDHEKTLYADDDREPVGLLLRLRLPPLIVGLVLGVGISILTSRFEAVLQANIHTAFFIPFVVYIADAIGTQTQTIYTRDLKTHRTNFHAYLFKELILGIILGVFFGAAIAGIIILWLADASLAIAVGISTLAATATAPLIALLTTEFLKDLHEDPAVGSGPIATVIQDATSIVIYGAVMSLFLL